MATSGGPDIERDGLILHIDPTSTKTQNSLTYWLVDWSGGHPTNSTGMDSMFTTSTTLRKTGTHSGTLNWANTPTSVTMPNNGSVITTTTGYPDYMDTTTYYAILYRGYLYAPEAGTYNFSINGDDAMDIIVDGTVVAYWYGGHGFRSDPARNDGSITLTKGWHSFQTRFEEQGGGDGIAIGWQPPNGSWEIIPERYLKPFITNLATPGINEPEYWHVTDFDSNNNAWMEWDGSTNQYIDLKLTRGDLSPFGSYEAVFRYDGGTGDTYRAIIGGNGNDFFIGKNTGNTNFGIQDGGYSSNLGGGYNVFDGDFHHLVYTNNNGSCVLYLDGVQKSTFSMTGASTSRIHYAGLESDGAGYKWNGVIPVVKLYDQVLSADEVQQNYNAYKNRFNL